MSNKFNNNNDYFATLKILLVGNSNVGKSSLLLRFTDDTFLPHEEVSATIGVDFKVHEMVVDEKKYKLTIWERFRTLTSSYYRGAQGIIFVYDVSIRETFDQLDNWFNELNTYCSNKNIAKIIIGNKIDKGTERAISRKEGEAYARKLQTLYTECSAKTKYGVEEAFAELVRKEVATQKKIASNAATALQTEKAATQALKPAVAENFPQNLKKLSQLQTISGLRLYSKAFILSTGIEVSKRWKANGAVTAIERKVQCFADPAEWNSSLLKKIIEGSFLMIHGACASGKSSCVFRTMEQLNEKEKYQNPDLPFKQVKALFEEFMSDRGIVIDTLVITDIYALTIGHAGFTCLCGHAIDEKLPPKDFNGR
ncbi:14313_t:CDS:10 [Entrophospora sp. SA101]|nr:14313_t:CDS:10 [Entrophospora sp. SA101]